MRERYEGSLSIGGGMPLPVVGDIELREEGPDAGMDRADPNITFTYYGSAVGMIAPDDRGERGVLVIPARKLRVAVELTSATVGSAEFRGEKIRE